jgi:hypothetical protein
MGDADELRRFLLSCAQLPESRFFVFNPIRGFNPFVTALKSQTVAHNRTVFLMPDA